MCLWIQRKNKTEITETDEKKERKWKMRNTPKLTSSYDVNNYLYCLNKNKMLTWIWYTCAWKQKRIISPQDTGMKNSEIVEKILLNKKIAKNTMSSPQFLGINAQTSDYLHECTSIDCNHSNASLSQLAIKIWRIHVMNNFNHVHYFLFIMKTKTKNYFCYYIYN